MKDSLLCCERLLTALEEMSGREAAIMAQGDFVELAELRRRMEPLVTELGERGPAVADGGFRRRVSIWLAHRQEVEARLALEISRVKVALDELDASGRRIRRLAPSYRSEVGVPRRLQAVG